VGHGRVPAPLGVAELAEGAAVKGFPIPEAELVGKTQKFAESVCRVAGWSMRVVKVNGRPCVVTRDYRTDRVNVEVEFGVVVRITGLG
jgi:hypothetical protein